MNCLNGMTPIMRLTTDVHERRSHERSAGSRHGSFGFALIGIAVLLTSLPAAAQTAVADSLNPLRADSPGIHLYSVSTYSAYYSSPLMYSGGFFNSALGADVGYGVGASIGWNLLRNGSGISITYSPSYNGYRRYSDLSAINHAFSLITRKRHDVARKWSIDFSASANARTTQQVMFTPSAIGQLADAPATFDELTQAVVAGRFSTDEIAALLNGATLPDSALGVALFGDYFLTAGAQTKLTYSPTPRLSVSAALSGTRFESLPRGNRQTGVRLLSNATVANASLDLSYAHSPRTSLNVDLRETKPFSRYSTSSNSSLSAGFNRILSRRWFTAVRAGVGSIGAGRQRLTGATTRSTMLIGHDDLGYKTDTHTILLSVGRSTSDPFGIGALSTTFARGGWSWRPHGRFWAVVASTGWERLGSGASRLGDGWTSRISLDRAISSRTGMTVAYAFLSNRGALAAGLAERSLQGLVVSFHWVPGGQSRARTAKD